MAVLARLSGRGRAHAVDAQGAHRSRDHVACHTGGACRPVGHRGHGARAGRLGDAAHADQPLRGPSRPRLPAAHRTAAGCTCLPPRGCHSERQRRRSGACPGVAERCHRLWPSRRSPSASWARAWVRLAASSSRSKPSLWSRGSCDATGGCGPSSAPCMRTRSRRRCSSASRCCLRPSRTTAGAAWASTSEYSSSPRY